MLKTHDCFIKEASDKLKYRDAVVNKIFDWERRYLSNISTLNILPK